MNATTTTDDEIYEIINELIDEERARRAALGIADPVPFELEACFLCRPRKRAKLAAMRAAKLTRP